MYPDFFGEPWKIAGFQRWHQSDHHVLQRWLGGLVPWFLIPYETQQHKESPVPSHEIVDICWNSWGNTLSHSDGLWHWLMTLLNIVDRFAFLWVFMYVYMYHILPGMLRSHWLSYFWGWLIVQPQHFYRCSASCRAQSLQTSNELDSKT